MSHQSWLSESCYFLPFFPDEDNLQGWFFAEDDGNQIKKQKHPLLLRQMPVVMSKLQEFKVRRLYVPKLCQFKPSCQGWLAQLECGANKAKVRGSTTLQAVGWMFRFTLFLGGCGRCWILQKAGLFISSHAGAPSVQIQSLHGYYCHPPFVLTCLFGTYVLHHTGKCLLFNSKEMAGL